MKTLTTLIVLLLLLGGATHLSAQTSGNLDGDPCYSLAENGPCVCLPGGEIRPWLAMHLISRAKCHLDQRCPRSMWDYAKAYYTEGTLNIDYQGGSYATGQQFRVQEVGGGSPIIIIFDGL